MFIGASHHKIGWHYQQYFRLFRIYSVIMCKSAMERKCNTCTVRWRPGESRISSEADLIIDHNMDSSMSSICWKFRQVHCFKYNTLSSKSCITMKQDRHHLNETLVNNKKWITILNRVYLLSLTITPVELLSSSFTLHNWIHCFQMWRISYNCQSNVFVRNTV